MKRIIFPTDFSESADKALEFAIDIAKKGGMEILLVNAYDLPYAQNVMSTSLIDIMRENSESGLKQLASKLEAQGVNVKHKSMMGNPIRVVKEITRKDPDSIVVMGTKGASGIEEVLIGSNAASVLQSTNVPVLAIPADAEFEMIEKIVYCTDFRSNKNDRALRRLASLAKVFDAEVMILHIQQEGQADLASGQRHKFDHHLSEVKHSFHILKETNVEEAILNFTKEKNADMLALLTRKYGIIRGLFHSSLTNKVAFHSKVPILALHESE
ncbi:MAG: universal stress protein [Flavobacteriia bacterium]|nr:universal stress protein [Flavobacteriia bacterium]